MEPIRVMVPERLYYPRQAAKSAAPGTRLSAAGQPASKPRPAAVRTPLEGPVIIQPQPQPMALTAALRVAGVLSWTVRTPEPPKRDAAPIVPGRREETVAIETPVPPRLDIPNRERRFSDINVAAAPAAEKAALPVEAGGTTPVEIASETKSDTGTKTRSTLSIATRPATCSFSAAIRPSGTRPSQCPPARAWEAGSRRGNRRQPRAEPGNAEQGAAARPDVTMSPTRPAAEAKAAAAPERQIPGRRTEKTQRLAFYPRRG